MSLADRLRARRGRRRRTVHVEAAPRPIDPALGHVAVCLPTYNEIENVEPMLRAVHAALDGRGEILVIDDGSPDGTADAADAVGRELGTVTVLRRRGKGGLGPAYLHGFSEALARGAERIVQMDCDFSHAPEDLRRLVPATEQHDLVLGSRYVEGGRVVNWPRRRVLLSRGGSVYARLMLGVPLHDVTAGFKCYRRAVLEAIPFDAVRTSGYGFNIELTYRAITAGFSVAELPITFTERVAGSSKMNGRIALEAIGEVPRLRLQAIGAARARRPR